MPRTVPLRTGLVALALALLVPVALPGAVAAEGNDASGDATIARTPEAEPPRNRSLSIQLVDNATGEPVAGVPVDIVNHWRADGERGEDAWSLVTDGNGTVSVNASDGRVRLQVKDPDWKHLRASFTLDGDLGFELPLRPNDQDLAEVVGVVTGADGEPVADAHVELDPVRACDDRRCAEARETRKAQGATVEANGTTIRYHWSSHPRHGDDVTDGEGRYAAAVPPGTYQVQAEADGHLPAEAEVEVGANETAEVNLSLTPVPADSVTLRGVLRDAETGEPLPGARLLVQNPRWGSTSVAVADDDGAYQVETKPGHVVLQATAKPGDGPVCIMGGGDGEAEETREERRDEPSTTVVDPEAPCADEGPDQAYLPRVKGLDVEAGETRNASLELRPEADPSATIQGWVLGPDEEPLAEATVRLLNEETGDHGSAGTGPNGSFAADVPAGYHTLVVEAPGHLPTAANVLVEEDETAEVVLELAEGEAARDLRLRSGIPTVVTHTAHRASEDGARAGDGAAPSGEATIAGGPGDLGPYEAASGDGAARSAGGVEVVPSAGAALALATLAAAAAAGRRLR